MFCSRRGGAIVNVQNVELLTRLNDAGLDMVVIGGIAGILHGSTLLTEDLDVCCRMTEQNMARLLAAIRSLNPHFRFHPKRPPLPVDPQELARYRTLNLQTDLG